MTVERNRDRSTQHPSAEPLRSHAETARQRFLAAAAALRQSIDETVQAGKARVMDTAASALARPAPAAAHVLQRLPGPGRIRDLSEAPDKALVAGAAAAASTMLPAAAPLIGGAARLTEKQIDRARDPDDGGRTR
jgi:hypothetical protein